MSRWFRFHADAMRNPKVLALSDKDFRLWVALMAVASENDGHIPEIDVLKRVLGMRLDHCYDGLKRLASALLIDVIENGYEPHNWNKFQYKSDTSTDRVKKHRAERNVSVTPPDTDKDTKKKESDAEASQKKVRVRGERLSFDWSPTAPLPQAVADLVAQWPPGRLERELDGFRDYWTSRSRDAAKLDWDRSWHNRIRDQHDKIMKDQRYGSSNNRIGITESTSPSLAFIRHAEAEAESERESERFDWSPRPEMRAIGSV